MFTLGEHNEIKLKATYHMQNIKNDNKTVILSLVKEIKLALLVCFLR